MIVFAISVQARRERLEQLRITLNNTIYIFIYDIKTFFLIIYFCEGFLISPEMQA